VPLTAMQPFLGSSQRAIGIMTWGGLRGGISVALALTLPPFVGREIVIAATYGVVIFSILVQALTLGAVVRAWTAQRKPVA
jgi:Na+:H+ antiporter